MNTRIVTFSWSAAFAVLLALPVEAAVFNLAADFNSAPAGPGDNSGGQWQVGFLDSTSPVGDPDTFLKNSANGGWVPFDTVSGAGWTHSAGGGFPFSGELYLPQSDQQIVDSGSLRDWPTAEGTNASYPSGVLGGHGPTIPFFTGWYGARFTAPSTGAYDVRVNTWQPQAYPDMIPPNPLYGGNTRPHQLSVFRDDANADANGQTLLARTPSTTRVGWINLSGTPEHTSETAPIPGDHASWNHNDPTQGAEEQARSIGKSDAPTTANVTGINLNAGESIIVTLAPYFFGTGGLQTGFNVLDVEVRSGNDRTAVTQWDLADDFSVHGSTSVGIGPDAAWSYGANSSGGFIPYDKILFGIDDDDEVGARENHGLGTSAPGWFFSAATEPETGQVTPVIIKDYDGNNFTTDDDGGGSPPMPSHIGDWSGGKVVVHTPTTEVSAERESVIRWTAPRAMTVDVTGDLWRVVASAFEGEGDRTQEYELLLNGSTVLASGTIGPNLLNCDPGSTTSACAESFSETDIVVAQDDTIDLVISPQDGGTSLTADFDESGTVDEIDLAIWQAAYGSGDGGDTNGDGNSDGVDFLTWQQENGMSGGGEGAVETFVGVDFTITESLSGVMATPEPSTSFLAALAILPLATRFVRGRFT